MGQVSFIAGSCFCAVALLTTAVFAAPVQSRIELLGASRTLGNGQPLLLGVHIEPKPGWKTYWRAPGESGLPPVFLFTAHENTGPPQIKWPAPKRLTLQGLESYGYDGPVIFPFFVAPQDKTIPVRLVLQVDYAVCLDICVPEQAVLMLDIPPGTAMATPDLDRLQASLRRVPRTQDVAGQPHIATSYITRNGQGVELHVEADAHAGFKAPDLFVDGAPDMMFSAPQISYAQERRRAIFRLEATSLNPAQPISGQTVILTLVDGENAFEKQVKLAEQTGTK